MVSNYPDIQKLEDEDHKSCASLKLNFDRVDNEKSTLYWRCRLSFAKYRLEPKSYGNEYVANDYKLSDLISKISFKVSTNPETVLQREIAKLDSIDHKKCLKMGYEFNTDDKIKVDNYFACRRALIEENLNNLPYGNPEYLKYQNKSYSLGYAVDKKIVESIEEAKIRKEKYPDCFQLLPYSNNYKRCTKAQDESRACFSEINQKKIQKSSEEKIICQKKAYIKYGDEMLKDSNKKLEEIKKQNFNSDYLNGLNFVGIGINESDFFNEKSKIGKKSIKLKGGFQENQETYQQKLARINSKTGLYERYELARLRQIYVGSCKEKVDDLIKKYEQELINDCRKKAVFVKSED